MDSMLMSCQTGNLEILKILVNDYNANVQVINSIDKRVGLHYACINNKPKVLSFLLGKNSSLKNFQDYQGCTPLYYAALNNHEKCVDTMLIHEANTTLANSLGLTAIEVTTSLNIQKSLEKKMAQTMGNTQGNDKYYQRTPIGNSNKLSCNSRKDEVSRLMQKAQAHHDGSFKEIETKTEGCKKWQVKEKKGILISPEQQARQKSLKKLLKPWKSFIKEDIKQQNESAKRCQLYMEKLQKINAPVKVKRRVKFEDFIIYRQIGEGAFGMVYLVKLKQGILEDKKKEEETADNEEDLEKNQAKQENLTEEEDEERRLALRLKQLHRGGYDEAEENPSQMYYALKIIDKTALKKRKIAEYIVSEKNVMQEVHHPFIAKMHFTFQDESHLFILMDFYPGGDLGRILEKEMELEEMQVKVWAAQIVLALEELHRKDIVYRDLKPENVVLDAKGNLHLIDFGLAKKGADAISKSFCGTPMYLPPEIIGRQGHNKMVDWYSLGVIIYELLVGRPPYFSKDCKQLFKDIQTQPLRIPKTLPEDAKLLLIGLLRKNYKLRLGFNGDAEEIKSHPWFSNINWERVHSKQYTCLKPMVLSIPSVPISVTLSSCRKSQIGQVDQKWSFFHFTEGANQEEDSSPPHSPLKHKHI